MATVSLSLSRGVLEQIEGQDHRVQIADEMSATCRFVDFASKENMLVKGGSAVERAFREPLNVIWDDVLSRTRGLGDRYQALPR